MHLKIVYGSPLNTNKEKREGILRLIKHVRILDWLLYQPEKYANSKTTTAVKKSFCGTVLNNKCTQVQMVPGKAKSGTGEIFKV